MTPTTATASTLPSREIKSRRAVNVDLWPGATQGRVINQRFMVEEYREGDVLALNRRFVHILEELRRTVKSKDGELQGLPDDTYHSFLAQLREVGAETYSLLPAQMMEHIASLEANEGERGIGLDFTFPASMGLLWEMIYTGSPTGPIDPQQFWGFRYPIGHLYWDTNLADEIKLRRGIFASTHHQLNHSGEELVKIAKKLKQVAEHLGLPAIVQHLESKLQQHDELCDDDFIGLLHSSEFAFGVVHFACHCVNPDPADSAQAHLCMTAHGQKLTVRLGRLPVLARHKNKFKYQPLVFLNACESATPLQFLQALDFPNGFYKFGAGGVIATACTMPDNFASAFASKFYEFLLNKPLENLPAYIGEALLETRLHFLREYNNPLGLGYGLYALSNQRLRVGD